MITVTGHRDTVDGKPRFRIDDEAEADFVFDYDGAYAWLLEAGVDEDDIPDVLTEAAVTGESSAAV